MNGRVPEDLCFLAASLSEDVVGASRPYAFASGRVLESETMTILSWGTAGSIELPGGLEDLEGVREAQHRLDRIPPSAAGAPHTPGPIALVSLPFDRSVPARLVLPAVAILQHRGGAGSSGVHSRSDGASRATAVVLGSREEVAQALERFPFASGAAAPDPGPMAAPPDAFTLESVRPHSDFLELVADAVAAIGDGDLDKVVLAREVAVTANRPFEQRHLIERLRALHPSCLSFAIDGFVGASPELLVRREGDLVTSQPLAGTAARSGDPEEDRRLAASLLGSAKERAEHEFVVGAIREALARHTVFLEAPVAPHLLELRNVLHLATTIHARLRHPPPGLLELAADLHPTAAIGGSPREAALAHIAKHETLERDRYAGPVGYVSAGGDGELWLGIRSALLDGCRARLIAGVGIVAGSDPAAELAETQLKLQALLAVAVRP